LKNQEIETASNVILEISPDKIDKVVARFLGKPGMLLCILEEVQNLNPNKYLPHNILAYISKKLKISLSKIYSVASFYSYFNLKPQGKHCITICRGTACHTKGSKALLDNLMDLLDLKEDPEDEGEKLFLTTKDREFTIRSIACFGQCALAPVCEIDNVIYSNMTNEKMRKAIESLKNGGK
jgi:NADH-quinone oxidoreductase subunit E